MLQWNPTLTDPKLQTVLRTLGEEFPIKAGQTDCNLMFEKVPDAETLQVIRHAGGWKVRCGRDSIAARGVLYALAGRECEERIGFRTLGMLFDCTRGNIITVEHFKYWLRRLALLGYNMAMIYVKDAYQLPDEPYFGYMRGAYSLEEMREVDAYAQSLNIEMVASIQALGHLEPVLRWPAYYKVKDTASVILVDEPASYDLLQKMLEFWSQALTSRRIHLGMDETLDLGRGHFLDKHGYEVPFDIYNRHLKRLCERCDALGLHPIIWSDMFIRYANGQGNCYDPHAIVPEDVKRQIPAQVQLSYWDYYHRDREIYATMLEKTRNLNGSSPFMASGIWTWGTFWTDYEMTQATVRPCIDACRQVGAQELIFTLWGDDGGYCDFDSAFSALTWAADYAFNETEDLPRVRQLFKAFSGADYDLQQLCGRLCHTSFPSQGDVMKISAAPVLWDDPLMGIVWRELIARQADLPEVLLREYQDIHAAVEGCRQDCQAGMMEYVWCLTEVLIRKIQIRRSLEEAYRLGDSVMLKNLQNQQIPGVIEAITQLLRVFRKQWLRSFKPYGLELMQIRLGGLIQRYEELSSVIGEVLAGERKAIDELEVPYQARGSVPETYLRCVTGCFFI